LVTEKLTKEEETHWLNKTLSKLVKDEVFFVVAEVDKKVVGSCDLQPKTEHPEAVGAVGIVVKGGYRRIGIGLELMKAVIDQARLLGLKTVTVNVFASNKAAIHLYIEMGFVESSRNPQKFFRQGKYVDEIVMAKPL
jgi:RimJ/RimL family protein N-acetyltransferase